MATSTISKRAADRDIRTDAEKAQPGAHADKFRDEREEISQHQVAHREKSPETPEAVEDQLGMAAMGDRTETHGHFLDDEPYQERKDHEGNEKTDSETRARGRIGKHARRVVLAEEDEDARPDEQPEHSESTEKPRTALFEPGTGHLPAIARAIHVFMRQLADQLSCSRRTSGGFRGGMSVAIG